jgi:hypothetical protein
LLRPDLFSHARAAAHSCPIHRTGTGKGRSARPLARLLLFTLCIRQWVRLKFPGATGRGTPRPVPRNDAVRHRSASTPTCGTQTDPLPCIRASSRNEPCGRTRDACCGEA